MDKEVRRMSSHLDNLEEYQGTAERTFLTRPQTRFPSASRGRKREEQCCHLNLIPLGTGRGPGRQSHPGPRPGLEGGEGWATGEDKHIPSNMGLHGQGQTGGDTNAKAIGRAGPQGPTQGPPI